MKLATGAGGDDGDAPPQAGGGEASGYRGCAFGLATGFGFITSHPDIAAKRYRRDAPARAGAA